MLSVVYTSCLPPGHVFVNLVPVKVNAVSTLLLTCSRPHQLAEAHPTESQPVIQHHCDGSIVKSPD